MKVFISVPMRDREEADILKDIEKAKQIAKDNLKKVEEPIEFVDAYFTEKPENSEKLYYLGESIKKIGECDAVCFADKWIDYPGCRVEHEVANNYDKIVIRPDGRVLYPGKRMYSESFAGDPNNVMEQMAKAMSTMTASMNTMGGMFNG